MPGFRQSVAILALLLVVPAAVEVLENSLHLALQGHSAHASGTSDSHAPESREHGCTGAVHLCGCCPSVAAELMAVGQPRIRCAALAASLQLDQEPSSIVLPRLDSPPRA